MSDEKMIALAMAGVMLCALPVCAATSPTAAVVATTVASSSEDAGAAAVREAAAAQGKSVAEYVNNAVVEVPGLSG